MGSHPLEKCWRLHKIRAGADGAQRESTGKEDEMAKIQVREEKAIMGVPNLMTTVREIASQSPTGQVWFRGVKDVTTHKLVPSIGREHWFAGRQITFDRDGEERLLRRFRRFARQYEGRVLDEWETLFLARHHGLPVRLMDWTANPLVALYMACEHHKNSGDSDLPNGCIWVLVPRENPAGPLEALDANDNPLDVCGVRLIDPMIVSPRMNVQGGIFTIQRDPWTSLDAYDEVPDDELDVAELIGYQVLGCHKAPRLKELNDLGINRRTLFPDYDGLAAGLVAEELLRRHASELNKAIRKETPDKTVTWP